MRRVMTYKMLRAAKRNIARAQMSRRGIREPRSVGRITRSRDRMSRPFVAAKAGRAGRSR